MARSLPQCVDTVIVGNGPSALILSYILHGNVPYYIGGHHDSILAAKLDKQPNLLHLTPDLYAHFLSSLRYSTQALPINTLLDTLIRPNADTEVNPKSCIEWRREPGRAVSHLAIGDTAHAGGQWADDSVSASADIGTLSYAEQLSLPGYSYADHLATRKQTDQCDFVRPSRAEFADYLSAYPAAVGIEDAVVTGTRVEDVYRTGHGFVIGSLGIHCKHLVLASGTFTVNVPPPRLLLPVASLDSSQYPLLVIGSGFSAADVIISAPPTRRIIHIFQWAPHTRPSPLRGCHHTAYPEYASIYRQMKIAAIASTKGQTARLPLQRQKSNLHGQQRDWSLYEGLPNAEVTDVSLSASTGAATLSMRLGSGEEIRREVGGLAYVVGRRGTLSFLSPTLQSEILGSTDENPCPLISGRTFRTKSECTLEVAKDVFITGSLTGDSLIRHAVGGCVFAAGRIMDTIPSTIYTPSSSASQSCATTRPTSPVSASSRSSHEGGTRKSGKSTPGEVTNGHGDLHLDRRKLTRAVEVATVENRYWVETGWWAGGLGPMTG